VLGDPLLAAFFSKQPVRIRYCYQRQHPVHCPRCGWEGWRCKPCRCPIDSRPCDPYTGPDTCPHHALYPCPKCRGLTSKGYLSAWLNAAWKI
jgi:hypothetical protein